jgi:hypothetical protein
MQSFLERYDELTEIELVDSLMGNGKTTATLRYIEGLALSNRRHRWIFCSEYLSELEKRTAENDCAAHLWRIPVEHGDATKTESLIEILKEPDTQLVAVTHALLLKASENDYVNHLLKEKGYSLFLDETIELINPYNGIKFSDFLLHKKDNRLTVDEGNYGLVQWIDDSVDEIGEEFTFTRLRNDCSKKRVYASITAGKSVNDSVALVTLQDEILFYQFDRVILSTYQFADTLMAAYFEIKNISWVACKDIQPYKATTKKVIADLITMISKHDKKFDKVALSSSWWDDKKRTKEDYKLLNNTIRNIGDNHGCKDNAWKLGYTVPKDSLAVQREPKGIHPVGYPHSKCLVDVDGNPTDEIDKHNNCYIPTNARASNDYASKDVMVHAYNRYPLLQVTRYLDAYNVRYSAERFALNELLQWVWRSAIRDGKPIHLAILSKRMRDLFVCWLKA